MRAVYVYRYVYMQVRVHCHPSLACQSLCPALLLIESPSPYHCMYCTVRRLVGSVLYSTPLLHSGMTIENGPSIPILLSFASHTVILGPIQTTYISEKQIHLLQSHSHNTNLKRLLKLFYSIYLCYYNANGLLLR